MTEIHTYCLFQFGDRLRQFLQVHQRPRQRDSGRYVIRTILNRLPQIRNRLFIVTLAHQKVAIEEERLFIRRIRGHCLLQRSERLLDPAGLLQMEPILEIRARRARKLPHRALGDFQRCRIVACVLMGFNGEKIQIRIIRLQLERAPRQRRRILKIAAFLVLRDHDLYQSQVAGLQS